MNSIAHAAGTLASPTGARVTSIEEGRAEHDQGYFFRMPDWLSDHLCAHHASGAAWALITLVGRKTRWGQHVPQRITLLEMLEHTRYAKQTISDALACLVGWGVLYEERESDRRYVRYALVDLTACSGPYADERGTTRIDLLEHSAYPIPETSLKSRPVVTSRYRSKKQTDISLKSNPNRSKKQPDTSLKSRLVESEQPAPEETPEAPLDYVEKRDTIDTLAQGETQFSGAHHSSHRQPALFAAIDLGKPHSAAPSKPAPKQARKRDPLWDTAVALFHQPMGGELKDWRYNIVPELHRQSITPEQLHQAALRYRREHPTWNFSFKAVFNHLGELLAPSQGAPVPTLAAAYQYAPAVPAYMRPRKEAP